MQIVSDPRISSFLIKVTARCNLNCDYCYVFNHADQSWKSLPSAMSTDTQEAVATRIAEYVQEKKLDFVLVIFHGGEPLLLNSIRLVNFKRLIKDKVPQSTKVDFSIQTNGVLLKEDDLDLFQKEGITISLSLDGPKEANDLHRLTPKGNSSFDKVLEAYHLLQKYPKIFTGVIAVIDPVVSPRTLLEFFNELNPPALDLLLPDANYVKTPPKRNENPNLYTKWLIDAFDIWVENYSHIKIRFFDNLILSSYGYKPRTDSFGFGDISLLSIESDGSYHDLDVLKITQEGQSNLNKNVFNSSIAEVVQCEKINAHRKLLDIEGLCQKCQVCPVVSVCGGGSVPHRFDGTQFKNPTIYCNEMLSLITHVQHKVVLPGSTSLLKPATTVMKDQSPKIQIDIIKFSEAKKFNPDFDIIYKEWCEHNIREFKKAFEFIKADSFCSKETINFFERLEETQLKQISLYPSTHVWAKVINTRSKGLQFKDLDGNIISADGSYLEFIKDHMDTFKSPNINPNDLWLTKSFGSKVVLEDPSTLKKTQHIVQAALKIIREYKLEIYNEILLISPVIVLIKNHDGKENNFISFSDNMVPGALFVSILSKGKEASPYTIAESILHEHRHQKLYMLENSLKLVSSNLPYVSSPWKEDPRPVSALFHAVYVFHELYYYWAYVNKSATDTEEKDRAKTEVISTYEKLMNGIETLCNNQNLLPISKGLIDSYQKTLNLQRVSA